MKKLTVGIECWHVRLHSKMSPSLQKFRKLTTLMVYVYEHGHKLSLTENRLTVCRQ